MVVGEGTGLWIKVNGTVCLYFSFVTLDPFLLFTPLRQSLNRLHIRIVKNSSMFLTDLCCQASTRLLRKFQPLAKNETLSQNLQFGFCAYVCVRQFVGFQNNIAQLSSLLS